MKMIDKFKLFIYEIKKEKYMNENESVNHLILDSNSEKANSGKGAFAIGCNKFNIFEYNYGDFNISIKQKNKYEFTSEECIFIFKYNSTLNIYKKVANSTLLVFIDRVSCFNRSLISIDKDKELELNGELLVEGHLQKYNLKNDIIKVYYDKEN